jgi:hypothetical protein
MEKVPFPEGERTMPGDFRGASCPCGERENNKKRRRFIARKLLQLSLLATHCRRRSNIGKRLRARRVAAAAGSN